jgi:hypothetical protein
MSEEKYNLMLARRGVTKVSELSNRDAQAIIDRLREIYDKKTAGKQLLPDKPEEIATVVTPATKKETVDLPNPELTVVKEVDDCPFDIPPAESVETMEIPDVPRRPEPEPAPRRGRKPYAAAPVTTGI